MDRLSAPRTGRPVLRLTRWIAILMLAGLAGPGGAGPSIPATPERSEESLRRAARLRGLALAEMEDGSCEEALVHLDELEELLPDNILPPINRAICLYRLQRPRAARAAVARARDLDPDNPSMLYTLAIILEAQGEESEWRRVLEHFAATQPADPRPGYLRALGELGRGEPTVAVDHLEEALDRAPENLVLMTELLGTAAAAGDSEALGDALDAIEDRLDGFDERQAGYAELIRDALGEGDAAAAQPPAAVLRNLLRPTELYQVYRVPLTGGRQGGAPLFPQLDFDPPLPKSVQGGQDIELAFSDASAAAGLSQLRWSRLIVHRRPGTESLLGLDAGRVESLDFQTERVHIERLRAPAVGGGQILAYDIDQDTVTDLVIADAERGLVLYPGTAPGFGAARRIVAPGELGRVTELRSADLDHDGDLDLLVLRAGDTDLYLQNDGDGSWSERAGELGLAGAVADTSAAALADFDDDGDLDLVTAVPAHGLRLSLNPIVGPFEDATAATGLAAVELGPRGVLSADFDNDGRFDLVAWGDGGSRLLVNSLAGFAPVELPAADGEWRTAVAADFDNDGDQDLAVVAASGRLTILRNRRDRWSAEPSPLRDPAVRELLVADLDADGDLDLGGHRDDGGLVWWRNDGGDRNQWLKISLRGKPDNSSKNNTQGLFTRIEARAGGAYQALLGNGGVNHLGLGARRQADVLRVVWTNGVAQIWQQVSARRTLVEEEVLKGSCPFLYTWDGHAFTFHTDLMWRSPLGMFLADGGAARHESAEDWVLIPGERLVAEAGRLWIQVTGELWETVYVDRLQMLAVDHPVSTGLVVDERFAPPGAPDQRDPERPPLHWIGTAIPPTSAVDHRGRDVLSRIRGRDGAHVDALPLDRYQGLTAGHHLDLAFTGLPRGERLRLVLWGWIFPTDSSINYALHQDAERRTRPPRLEVRNTDGSWSVLHASIGLPSGKRKAMVVELPRDLGPEATLRLSTNLQIYWDAALIAAGDPQPAVRYTRLEPVHADLHFRGFSRLVRESPTGPHLFDYARSSPISRFRGMRGRFTRYGDVTPLLAGRESHSVVMSAGDEMTVHFEAGSLPPLPPGWRRDWVLFTDGWVKDADLHTTRSQTVEPLPYHGMSSYPDRPHRFPDGAASRRYLEEYQTRWEDDRRFVDLLKAGGESLPLEVLLAPEG